MSDLTARIRQLKREGVTNADICKQLHVGMVRLYRAIGGRDYIQRGTPADLKDIDSIPDDEANRLKYFTHPIDEDATTKAVYEAAERIRERRPRMPVGASNEGVEVTRSRVVTEAGEMRYSA